MATFIMLPEATVGTSGWTGNGGSSAVYSDVDNDNGDTEYAYSATNNERMIFDLVDITTILHVAYIESIDTVQIKASAAYTHTSASSLCVFRQIGTAADSSLISNGTDTITVAYGGSYSTYSGTAETTSDGTNGWVYADLNGLQIRVDKFRDDRHGQMRISYLYAEVTYTPTPVPESNATFFGANF